MAEILQDNEIYFGGHIFNTTGPLRATNITSPPNPVVFGDSEKQGDTQVMTQFTQSSYLGGSGRHRGNIRTDTTRFWRATMDTAYLDVATIPPESVAIGKPPGVTANCDILISYRGVEYAFFADKMYSIGSDLTTFGTPMGGDSFPSVPTDALVFNDKLYVACTTEIHMFDDVLTHTFVAQDGKYLVVWDNKLWAITREVAGWKIYQTLDGVTWTAGAALPRESEITDLLLFRDVGGSSVIAALSASTGSSNDGGLWMYNADVPKWYLSEVTWPAMRSDQEARGARFRDGKLYVTIGNLSVVGIQPGNPFVITPVGLDQDEGVPPGETGKIVALTADVNFMIAKIDGSTQNADVDEFTGAGPWSTWDWPTYAGSTSIRRWFGGWHNLLWAPFTAPPGKGLDLSSAYDARRLWFSLADGVHYQDMTDSTYNPHMNPTRRYQLSGELETSWWSYGTEAQTKLHGHIWVETLDCDADNLILVYYGTDLDDGTWTPVATIQNDGLHEIIPTPGGIPGAWFRYKFVASRGANPMIAPKLRLYRTETMRRLPATYAFGVQFDLTRPCRGRSPYTQMLELKALADGFITPELQLFWYRDDDGTEKQFYATITQMNGTEITGTTHRGEGQWLVSITAPYRVYDGASQPGVTVHATAL